MTLYRDSEGPGFPNSRLSLLYWGNVCDSIPIVGKSNATKNGGVADQGFRIGGEVHGRSPEDLRGSGKRYSMGLRAEGSEAHGTQ